MFSSIAKFFAKQLLPTILANLVLDIDTVEKSDGYYLRIRVEALGFTLVDELVKLSGQKSSEMKKKETLTLDSPIDEVRTNQIDPNKSRLVALGKK